MYITSKGDLPHYGFFVGTLVVFTLAPGLLSASGCGGRRLPIRLMK